MAEAENGKFCFIACTHLEQLENSDRLTSQLTAASNEASTLKIENEKLKKGCLAS